MLILFYFKLMFKIEKLVCESFGLNQFYNPPLGEQSKKTSFLVDMSVRGGGGGIPCPLRKCKIVEEEENTWNIKEKNNICIQ